MSDWYSEMIEQAHKNDPTARIASLETALAESQLKLEGAERWNGIYQGEIAALKAECERLRRDAELYRKLRAFNWHDNAICCVVKPMENVKLGAYCPSGENLDAAIDAASAEGGAVMLRISAPHFVAGIVQGGRVAPIIKYMKGWTLDQIKVYCARKGWKIEVLP